MIFIKIQTIWSKGTLIITISLGPEKFACYTITLLCMYQGYKNNTNQRKSEIKDPQSYLVIMKSSCARQNDVNAMRRSAGNSSFCQAHAFQSGHLLQLIANSSFVCFIRRHFIASQILSSKIISWNFICNAKGIFKSWECYRLRSFAGNKHARSHCQFSCQARTLTSFCRAHNEMLLYQCWL